MSHFMNSNVKDSLFSPNNNRCFDNKAQNNHLLNLFCVKTLCSTEMAAHDQRCGKSSISAKSSQGFPFKIYFLLSFSCSSYVGRIGGKQVINLASGCWRMGTVAHEMGK